MKYRVGDRVTLEISAVHESTCEYEFKGISNLCLTEEEVVRWDVSDKDTDSCDKCWVKLSDMNHSRCKTCIRRVSDYTDNFIGVDNTRGEI